MEPLVNSKTLARTISNIEENKYAPAVVAEACKQLKIPIDKLVPQALCSSNNAIPEIQRVRNEHYEAKRKMYVRKIAEYLISQNSYRSSPSHRIKSITANESPSSKDERIAKEIKVKENRVLIQKKEEQRIQHVKQRLSKEVQVASELSEQKKKKNLERDLKIQKIREDKYRELRIREISEIRKMNSPPKLRDKTSNALTAHSDEQEISQKLHKFYEKMKQSEIRHIDYLKLKIPQTTRNRTVESKKDLSYVQKAQQLQKSIEESRQRRIGYINKGVEKIHRHLSLWEEKRLTAKDPSPRRWAKKEKVDKARANVKDLNITRALIVAEKNKLKQEDAQENLNRNKMFFEERRAALLEKVKETYFSN